MKFIHFLFIFLLFCLNPLSFINASFIKYSSNPLLSGTSSQWDEGNIKHPFILYDNGIYKMWYSGQKNSTSNWSIGYAVSSDGLTWSKPYTTPAITADANSIPRSYSEPTVIKFSNSDYRMWFSSQKIPNQNDSIGYATSTDGISWNIYDYQVLKPIGSGGLAYPSVVFTGSKFLMWYSENKSNWKINLATSTDGINWIPYPNNPVLQKTNALFEFSEFGEFHVNFTGTNYWGIYNTNVNGSSWAMNDCYTYSSDGINWIKPENKNPIFTIGPSGFDSKSIGGGTPIMIDDKIYFWYAGQNSTEKWQIGLAYDGENPIPIPTPSVFPLPSPTPEIIPTPTPRDPIVIVPGIMASWNREVLLENKENSTTDWNLIPFVKEYDGIIKTLENLGYIKNINLFIWPYDWRKSIDTIALQLDSFINQKVKPLNKNSKIHFISHSLGGLVSRTWVQKNTNIDFVKKLIAVGSPHSGVIQPYKLWEGGEIDKDYGYLSFAGRILLMLSNQSFTTNRTVIQQKFPVLRDLLPTEPYLISEKTLQFIPQSQMRVWNKWLTQLNINSTSILPNLISLRGSGRLTPYTYTVTRPSYLDAFLGNWVDGKPIATNTSDGDGTVTLNRGTLTSLNPVTMPFSHNELIASKAGIDQILTQLSINHEENSITEGAVTTIRPGLFLYIRSPATLQITYNGQTISDQDGIIFIPGITDGTYSLQVKGTGNGVYHLGVLQFTESDDYWKEYTGMIEAGKTKEYTIQFDQKNPNSDPLGQRTPTDRFAEFELLVKNLATISDSGVYKKLTMDISTAKRALDKKQWLLFKDAVELILTDFSTIRTVRPTSVTVRNLTLSAGDSLIDLYQSVHENQKTSISKYIVESLGKGVNEMEKNLEKLIETLASYKRLSHPSALLFLEGQNYRKKADVAPVTQLARKYMLYTQAQLLFGEIR